MKKLIVTLFCCFNLFVSANAQTNIPSITFLQKAPLLDGVLDKDLSDLAAREFAKVDKSDKSNPDIKASYRLAYTCDFLYVYVEIETDQVSMRDLGYQNGDGISLLLANPKGDKVSSDEFNILGFSPQVKPERLWQKQVIIYKDNDFVLNPLRNPSFATKVSNGKTGYEILLPWKEIHPYHPWLMKQIGMNLCFIKGIGDKQANEYYMMFDKNILSEQSKHAFATVTFQTPTLKDDFQWFASLTQNNASKQDTVYLQIAGLSSKKDSDDVSVFIHYGEGERATARLIDLTLNPELSKQQFPIRTQELPPAGYLVKWAGNRYSMSGENGITIMPQSDFFRISMQIDKLKPKLAEGSVTTLRYHLKNLADSKRQLKKYETAAYFRLNYTYFIELLDAAMKGKDVIADKQGIQRRAFTSSIDSTLQPYSVKTPNGFNRKNTYPLLVYLHNSGEDDRNVLKTANRSNGSYIEIAPFARGTENCYVIDSAQTDIAEAIADVKANYPIDSTGIVLSGFSMGGYGVFRTYMENPKQFKALAVFSFNPNLANKDFGKGYPDFTDPQNLKIFKGIPIFIYHEKSNANYPYSSILELVEKLKKAGAKVELFSDEKVQGDLNQYINGKYLDWLDRINTK